MTRDDLYSHYRRYYHPANATLVVVGDVDADDVLRRAERHFGGIAAGRREPIDAAPVEPPQLGERRVVLEREGTTAYLKLAYPAPSIGDSGFLPDARARRGPDRRQGLNLWCAFRGLPPQRKARLYVGAGRARPGVGRLRGPPADGRSVPLHGVVHGDAGRVPRRRSRMQALAEIERVRTSGVTPEETARAIRQLKARLVFETDSPTNIAHQLGYFETVAGPNLFSELQRRIQMVTAEQVSDVARRRLDARQRTVGWFRSAGDRSVSAPTLARGLSPLRAGAAQPGRRHRAAERRRAGGRSQPGVLRRLASRSRPPAGLGVPDLARHRPWHRRHAAADDRRRAGRSGRVAPARRDPARTQPDRARA